MQVRLRSCGVGLLVLFLLVLASGSALAAAKGLSEIEAVAILQDYGVVKGDPSGALLLDQPLTRAQAAAVFVRSRGAQGLAGMLASQVPFEDMVGHWAAGEVALAYRLGLIKGDGDGRFRPDSPISYVEVLTVLLRMVEQEPTGPWNPMLILAAATKAGISPTGVDLMSPAVRGKIFWSLAATIAQVPLPDGLTILQKYVDSTPPEVAAGVAVATSRQESITVVGTAIGAFWVEVAGIPASFDRATGKFQQAVPLQLGNNSITVLAQDAAGNQDSVLVQVERLPNIANLKVVGPARLKAESSVQIKVEAVDPLGRAMPLAGVAAEMTGPTGSTFDLASGLLKVGNQRGVGLLTLRSGEVTASYAFEVSDVSARANRVVISSLNEGRPLTVRKVATVVVHVVVHVVDAAGVLVTDDDWRTVLLTSAGPVSLSIGEPAAVSRQGIVTFLVTPTAAGLVNLRVTSSGMPDATVSAQVFTPIRVVLASNPATAAPDGVSAVELRALLQDDTGKATVNSTPTDILVDLSSSGSDGIMTHNRLVIKPGQWQSDGAVSYRAGIQVAAAAISGQVVSGHGYSMIPVTIAHAPLPGARMVFAYQTAVMAPGGQGTGTSINVRVVDPNNNLVTTGSYAFQFAVSTSNGEALISGLPEGVSLTFENSAQRPVTGAVVGRTYQGQANLRLSYNKSGVVQVTPLAVGPSYQAFHPAINFGSAAGSAGLAAAPFSLTFAGAPSALRLTVDSALGLGQDKAAASPGNTVRLNAQVVDSAGAAIPGYAQVISLVRTSGTNVTTVVGQSQKATVNGAAEFVVQGLAAVGSDTYVVRVGSLQSPAVSLHVRDRAPSAPVVAAVRGSRTGDPSPVIGLVGPDAEYMDIQLQPQPALVTTEASNWNLVKVYRKGETAPVFTGLVNMLADPPILKVPKSALAQGRSIYEVQLHNGYGESPRSADHGLSEALNALYQGAYQITAAYYDHASARLTLRTAGLQPNGMVDPARLSIVKGEQRLALGGGSVSVVSVSAGSVVLALGDLAAQIEPDRFFGTVVLQVQDGWYQSVDGALVAPGSGHALLRPSALITHAVLDVAAKRLVLHGSGFSQGTLALDRVRIEQGHSQVLFGAPDKVTSVSDQQVQVALSPETLLAINALSGSGIGVAAEPGWLRVNAEGGPYNAGGIAGPAHKLYVRGSLVSAQYHRLTKVLTLTGSGFSGTQVDPTKLVFTASVSVQAPRWSPTAATSAVVVDDLTIQIQLTAQEEQNLAKTFGTEASFGGRTLFMNTLADWLSDERQRSAVPIPENSILFTIPTQ